MTLTRREAIISAAATVAAAALPAMAVAEDCEIVEMTVASCRHVLNIPWMAYGAPEIFRIGDVFPTKLRNRTTGQPVRLRAIDTLEWVSRWHARLTDADPGEMAKAQVVTDHPYELEDIPEIV